MDAADLPSSEGETGAGMGFTFLILALVLASGAIGFLWHQQGWWPAEGSDSNCQEIRTFAEQAEELAITATIHLSELRYQLEDIQSHPDGDIGRRNELAELIPAAEIQTLLDYQLWSSAVNLNRDCFTPAELLRVDTQS
jgi:Na+-transporting methylmalonyl-CoA/oxaloacetate decarboxylase gamma subunit